ncbi:MAG: hypothetical protein WD069_15460 [Planctomycetales bacterium]
MKSEHRRELHGHELQRWSAEARRFLEQHATRIIVVICAVILLAVGIWAWRRNVEQGTEAGWARLTAAGSAEQYAEVAEDFSGSEVARWARLREAELHLQDGMQAAFSSRDVSRSSFKKSEQGFRQLLADKAVAGLIRQRAMFGLATVLEATSDGNVAPAIAAYQELVDEFGEGSIYARPARDRIAALESPEAAEFYAWFHRQDPKPRDRDLPSDLGSSRRFDLSRPPGDAEAPDGPGLPESPSSPARPVSGPSDGPPPPPLPIADDAPAPRLTLPPENGAAEPHPQPPDGDPADTP